jgi:hypothetical protein
VVVLIAVQAVQAVVVQVVLQFLVQVALARLTQAAAVVVLTDQQTQHHLQVTVVQES